MAEIPRQAELRASFQQRDVEFLSVCHRRGGVERLKEVIETKGAPARQMLDEGEKGDRISDRLGAAYLPSTFLIDRAGRVRLRYLGDQGPRFEVIERELRRVLAEAPGR